MPNALERFEKAAGVAYFSGTATAQDPGVTETLTDKGTLIVRGLKVFKSGTFRDSMGDQRTWEPVHMQQIALNYQILCDAGIFADVPWREDHWGGVNQIAGYMTDVFTIVEGDITYIAVEVEFTDADAIEKYQNGTYRARSAEVGIYETNDESFYWPCLLGVAWVDIGAVEGLYSKHSKSTTNRDGAHVPFVTLDQEAQMGDKTPEQIAAENAEAVRLAAEAGAAAAIAAQAATEQRQAADRDAAAAAAAAVEALTPEQRELLPTALVTLSKNVKPVAFRVHGNDVTDPALVQEHITSLEANFAKGLNDERENFVAKLADDNKLARTQLETEQEFVLELSDAAYAKYVAKWEAAPVISLFNKHVEPANQNGGDKTPSEAEIATCEAVIAQHRRSGMPEDKVQATASFKRLAELQSASK